jgi:hypothetical protein
MSLTDFSALLRRIFPYLVLGLLMFLILFYMVRLVGTFIASRTRHTTLNPIFEKIKKLEIPGAPSSGGIKYTLDTVEGTPQTATDAAHVYFLPPQPPRLGYREKIYLMARAFGFDTSRTQHTLASTEATFKEDKKTLDIDISNFNFSYVYDIGSDNEFFKDSQSPQPDIAEAKAVEFLQGVDRYPQEFATGRTNTIYLFFNTKDKTMAVLDSQALQVTPNLIEVDFYRPDLDDLPIVPPKYFNSQNFVMLNRTGDSYRVARAQVRYFDRSTTQIGTYPLKTGPEAYEDLKAGRGFVASPVKDAKNIIINKMFLAYFDPQVYQEYLRPVYVFLGNNNFVAYVDAVRSDYVAQ